MPPLIALALENRSIELNVPARSSVPPLTTVNPIEPAAGPVPLRKLLIEMLALGWGQGPSHTPLGCGALRVAPSILNCTDPPVAVPPLAAPALVVRSTLATLTVLPLPEKASVTAPPVAFCAAPSCPGLALAVAEAAIVPALNEPPNARSTLPPVALAPVTGPAPNWGVEASALASRLRATFGLSVVSAVLENDTDPARALPAEAPPSPPVALALSEVCPPTA